MQNDLTGIGVSPATKNLTAFKQFTDFVAAVLRNKYLHYPKDHWQYPERFELVFMSSASLDVGLLLRHELAVIAAVEEDHAVQFVPLYHGPASALSRVHFVVAIPGPFDGWLAVPCRQAAIHLAVDVAEVELALVVLANSKYPSSSSSMKSSSQAPIETIRQRPVKGLGLRFICHQLHSPGLVTLARRTSRPGMPPGISRFVFQVRFVAPVNSTSSSP